MTDPVNELREFNATLNELMGEAPELKRFAGYIESAENTGALDRKTKELTSLAISVALRCEPCILWHTDAALTAGATHEEVVDVLKVAVVLGGGPALTYAVKAYEVLQAMEE